MFLSAPAPKLPVHSVFRSGKEIMRILLLRVLGHTRRILNYNKFQLPVRTLFLFTAWTNGKQA
jgi:hypothetical protein